RQEIEASLLIAGFPTTEFDPERLRSLARRQGIDDDVTIDARYLPLEDVGPLVRTGSVMVLPYRTATASGVLQVAYVFGRPVVVTEVGDLPASVEHGETGLVVPPRDPDQLARALVKMLSAPNDLERMGAAALRVTEERFSWDPIARQILDAYEGLT
ncbi:MAG: glycosyltransferase, partial [Phycisphaeraceae bacterium]|nr:glycosyltransferase [Phycisphaeraceae bacterium]